MAREITIGIQAGELALRWANWVKGEILKLDRETRVNFEVINLPEEVTAATSLGQIKEENALAVEIRKELLSGNVNTVIQSADKLPFSMSDGVRMAAVLERKDVRNVLLSSDCKDISKLPRRAKVGTCGILRKAQVLRIRQDLGVIDLQGDFPLFLSQLKSGRLSALVLGAADVELMEWDEGQDYDRLGLDEDTYPILGIEVPHITVPVRPGRNLSSIVEVAARNQLLKQSGHHSARDFQQQLLQGLTASADERGSSADDVE